MTRLLFLPRRRLNHQPPSENLYCALYKHKLLSDIRRQSKRVLSWLALLVNFVVSCNRTNSISTPSLHYHHATSLPSIPSAVHLRITRPTSVTKPSPIPTSKPVSGQTSTPVAVSVCINTDMAPTPRTLGVPGTKWVKRNFLAIKTATQANSKAITIHRKTFADIH